MLFIISILIFFVIPHAYRTVQEWKKIGKDVLNLHCGPEFPPKVVSAYATLIFNGCVGKDKPNLIEKAIFENCIAHLESILEFIDS